MKCYAVSTRLFLFLTILVPGSAHGKFLSDFILPRYGSPCCDWDFVAPNEQNPAAAIPILSTAPTGVYVSVGTERGFIGAALTPNATHLLLLDVDKKAVAFNYINIALLKISLSQNDYRYLRLVASYEQWRERFLKLGLAKDPDVAVLGNEASWAWWHWRLNQQEPTLNFAFMNQPPGAPDQDFAFKNANYLYEASLFWKLKAMANAGRIQAAQADLGDPDAVTKVSRALQAANLKVSILDLSNAWIEYYIGEKGVLAIVDRFRSNVDNKALLLLTDNRFDAFDPDINSARIFKKWAYRAFSFGFLASYPRLPKCIIEFLEQCHWALNADQTIDSPNYETVTPSR